LMKFRLPIAVERAVAESKAIQMQIGSEYERKLRHNDVPITCKKGCTHCCHHPFLITILEGILLLRYLRANGLWTTALRKRLEAHRDKTLRLAHDVWLLSNTPCPLLEDNLCVGHAARPLHCRATFSVGDPDKCHPHKLGEDTQIVPSTDVIIAFNAKLAETLQKKMDVAPLLLPVSEAVLLAREVEVEGLSLEDVADRYKEDLSRA